GRLAATGRAEQTEELALRDLEVDRAERLQRAVALGDPAELDRRSGSTRSRRRQSRRLRSFVSSVEPTLTAHARSRRRQSRRLRSFVSSVEPTLMPAPGAGKAAASALL